MAACTSLTWQVGMGGFGIGSVQSKEQQQVEQAGQLCQQQLKGRETGHPMCATPQQQGAPARQRRQCHCTSVRCPEVATPALLLLLQAPSVWARAGLRATS